MSRLCPRRALRGAFPLAALLAATPVSALDLVQSYEAALLHEPSYQAARAAAAATVEVLPQARANLLPQVQFSAGASNADTKRTSDSAFGPVTQEYDYPSYNYGLSVRQPLLRLQNWVTYEQAKVRVDAAQAELDSQSLRLGMRVAEAYFNTLYAEDILATIRAQKQAALEQLKAAELGLTAGQGTRTDRDDAQASYDLIVAQELEAEQRIHYNRHQLEVLVGQPILPLAPLAAVRMDLTAPTPATLEEWITVAEQNNPELRKLALTIEVAARERDKARYGHYPTVDLVAQQTISDSDSDIAINQRYETTKIGVQLALPLYTGGYLKSKEREASSNHERSLQEMDARRLAVHLEIRRYFEGTIEGISRIKALEQAIGSAEQAVRSNRKGVEVGTRSTLDVLQAIQKKAEVEKELAGARYRYAMARLQLVFLTGTGEREALAMVNGWLGGS